MILLVMLMLLVGTLSNSEENFKRETLVMSHYNKGDTDKALRVGLTSLDASHELTAMRAYILSSCDKLGEHVFEYPQYYASEGLLPPAERTSPLVPDSVYSLLGTMPLNDETALDFFSRLAHTDSATRLHRNYYLTSLLLEKQLIEFKSEVLQLYGPAAVDSLPKHYREALMLYADIADSPEIQIADSVMHEKLGKLRELEAMYDDAFIRGNYVRRSFGRTYWWYFLYSN
jgi:hypothetical protein